MSNLEFVNHSCVILSNNKYVLSGVAKYCILSTKHNEENVIYKSISLFLYM